MRSRWRSGLVAFLVLAVTAIASAPLRAVAQPIDVAAAQKRFQDLYAAGDYAAALAEAQKTEAAAKRGGTNNFAYVSALNDLARAHQALARYGEAAAMFKQVLATLQSNLPPTDPRLAQPLANLATVYLLQANPGEAEKLYKRALDISTKAQGGPNQSVALLMSNLADVYKAQARYDEAEAQYKRALDMAEKTTDPSSLLVALILNNLTKVYEDQSRFQEVEDASRRALAIREKALGPNHPDVAASVNNLAHVYERLGRYAEADKLFQRSIEIWEKALGPKHPYLATSLLNLASVYADEDRFDEAEALYKRALGIREAAFGPNHSDVATVLNNLAAIYEAQGRSDELETHAKRALAIVTKTLGPNNPDTAKVIRKLGVAYDAQGRYADADAQFKRALDIATKAFGPEHRFIATVLLNQGQLFEHQRRYDDAEHAYKRALAINEKARGPNHPDTARTLNHLAALSVVQNKPGNALAYSRKATAAVLAHANPGNQSARQTRDGDGLIEQRSGFFVNHVASLAAGTRAGVEPAPALAREAFEIAQWANQSSAAAAVQQLSPRFASGNDALAAVVRQDQDLSAYRRDREKALVEMLAKPAGQSNPEQIDKIRRQIEDTERKLAATRARLEKDFPDYAALSNPRPLKVEDVQKLLGKFEALVLLLTGEEQSYVFAVTADGFDWRTIPAGRDDIAAKVTAFRRGLELDTMQLFDLTLANELYTLLLGPVDALVEGQGTSAGGAVGGADGIAVPSTGDGEAGDIGPAGQKSHGGGGRRALPRRRMADQAPGRQHAAVGGEPAGVADARAGEGGRQADDRIWRSGLRPARDTGRGPQTLAIPGQSPRVQRLLARRRHRSQHAHAGAAAASRHRRRAQGDCEGARRLGDGHPARPRCHRDRREARAARQLPHRLFRHPRPGGRRRPGRWRSRRSRSRYRPRRATTTTVC